jgi:diaminopimelate decarboxylase
VVDSFDEIERLRGRGARVMLRVTPGIRPSTHSYIQTGQEDSKFGFGLDDVERAVAACAEAGLELDGLHAHIGSQVFELEGFERLGEVLSGIGDWPLLNLGGGLGIAYTRDEHPPPVEEYVEALLSRAPGDVTVLCEPGRSLGGNAGVEIYTVGTVKRIPSVRTYVAVDGGMSDNPRPVLYGSGYEAFLPREVDARRPRTVTVVGKHCESGDVLVRDARVPADLAVGDVLATPVTGAYGHSMGSNYNKVPRPAVVFARGGDARLVVRRQTYDDLLAQDL